MAVRKTGRELLFPGCCLSGLWAWCSSPCWFLVLLPCLWVGNIDRVGGLRNLQGGCNFSELWDQIKLECCFLKSCFRCLFKFQGTSQLFKGIPSGVYYWFTCVWWTPLETFVWAWRLFPCVLMSPSPHTWDLWVDASMKFHKFWWLNSFCMLQKKGNVIKLCYHTVLCRKSSSHTNSAFWHSLELRWICWKVASVFHLPSFLLFL